MEDKSISQVPLSRSEEEAQGCDGDGAKYFESILGGGRTLPEDRQGVRPAFRQVTIDCACM